MATMLRFVAVAVFVCVISMDQYLCIFRVGGLSQVKDVDNDVKKIFLETVTDIKQAMKKDDILKDYANADLEPVSYRSQPVSGTNYFIKVQVESSDVFFHVRIYKPGSWQKDDDAQLNNLLSTAADNGDPIKEDTPIEYF